MLVDLKGSLVQGQLLAYLKQNGCHWTIEENAHYRWLTMDQTVQSVMQRAAPEVLTFPHQQPLKGLIEQLPKKAKILELGLGGGSHLRYIKSVLPNSQIEIVENSRIIIDWFNDYFNPKQLAATLHHADANTFLASHNAQADLLITDIYNRHYSVFSQLIDNIFPHLENNVKPHGLLYINFIPEREQEGLQLKQALEKTAFKLLWGNQIIGFKNWIYLLEKKA